MKSQILAFIVIGLLLVVSVDAEKAIFDKCKKELDEIQKVILNIFDQVPTGPIKLPESMFIEAMKKFEVDSQKLMNDRIAKWREMKLSRTELNKLKKLQIEFVMNIKDKAIEIRNKY